jgi:c(7)-type cytochrome triheme protein
MWAALLAVFVVALGFDHHVHDRNLVVSGGEELPCARCHTLRGGMLVGKPDHAACFGACHGATPVAPKRGGTIAMGERGKVCMACHAESALTAPYTGKLAVPYPPYAIDPDFGIALGHKQHAAVACTQCHTPDAKTRPAPHARCAGCHDGKQATAMASCNGCHPAAIGKPQPPELAALHDTVSSAFSHRAHDKRGAKDCALCHAAIKTTDDTELPRPTVKDCVGCHDGKQAFSTLTTCRRCHDREAPPDDFKVARPEQRFRHDGSHADVVKAKPCSACHPLSPKGEIMVAGHAACTECHADDFAARWPKKCGACHNATEPWRKLEPDRELPERTEFGATLDHAKHPGACASCHELRTATTQLRPPRGHSACMQCHHVTGGPAPQLTQCDGCHRAGRAAAREAERAADPWSVRRVFDHGAHPGECQTCHVDLAGADVVKLAVPQKPSCASCHDGTRAFKLTGTTCTRCHEGKQP